MRSDRNKKKSKGFMDRKGRRHRLNSFLRDTDSKYIRRGIFIILGAIVFLVIMLVGNSEPQLLNSEEIAAVRDKGVLVVGVLENIPNFSENREGLEIELGMLLAEKIIPEMSDGAAASFFTITTTSIESHLQDGSIDVAIALMRKGENDAFAYSDAYYTDPIVLAVRKGEKNTDFNAKTIGYVFEGKSMDVPSELEKFAKENNASLKAYAGYADMLDALNSGRIDGAMMYGVYADKYAKEYSFELSPVSLGYAEYAIAAYADKPAFAEIANIMLKEIKENGKLSLLLP